MGKNSLILFTAGFPFGNKNEPFLEAEIPILAREFEKIIIFPLAKKGEGIRALPGNITVEDRLSNNNFSGKKKILVKKFFSLLKILFSGDLSFNGILRFWKNHRILLDIIAKSFLKADIMSGFLKSIDTDKYYFYDYWFFNATFILGYLKQKKQIPSFFCRAHGFDVYDDRWDLGGVPFLEYRIKQVEKVYCVSKHGEEYLKRKVGKKYEKKIKLSYLGVKKPLRLPAFTQRKESENYLIISVGRVVDFKRIHLIPEVLASLDLPVRWIHFGDGPLMETLIKKCQKLPPNISVELKGHVDNKEVLRFYEINHVDLFLSLSLSEGLPVSMMEAISYGIPIAATSVCGVPEIVVEETGILFDPELGNMGIANSIELFLLKNEIKTKRILDFFEEKFFSEKNFMLFLNSILFIK